MKYLASPYSTHNSVWPTSLRYTQNLRVLATLTSHGEMVISPIVQGHILAQFMRDSGLPLPSYEWWIAWSKELLAGCDGIYVLTLDGWEDSQGVCGEITFAKKLNLPIIYIDSEGNQITYFERDDE